MKPLRGLWKQIATFENLHGAYRSAAKGKRFRGEVLAFSSCLEDNLFALIHCDSYRLCREIFGAYGEYGGEWYDGWFALRRGHPEEQPLE
ncbi:hypothetical protein AGMMS49975_08810 [Clostridia bacterium]|nr:hypothetical protein AGMMS49975_08810 [Clostridia bacterium]